MRLRSLLVRGAVAGVLAGGALGFTAAAAHAGPSCEVYFYRQGLYYTAYTNDWNNFVATVGQPGGQPAADYYYNQWELDYASYQYYSARLNSCMLQQP